MAILLQIGASRHGMTVEDGEWVFRSTDGQRLDGETGAMAMLPLLQQPIGQVRHALEAGLAENRLDQDLIDRFPFDSIILTGLKWPTDFWVGLALKWLAERDELAESAEVAKLLSLITAKKAFPQSLRHQAMKLAAAVRKRTSNMTG